MANADIAERHDPFWILSRQFRKPCSRWSSGSSDGVSNPRPGSVPDSHYPLTDDESVAEETHSALTRDVISSLTLQCTGRMRSGLAAE